MVRNSKNKADFEVMRRLIGAYLTRKASLEQPAVASFGHLDEDAFNAFVEGRLSEAQAVPYVSHLVQCGFCRHITAELARLQTELGNESVSQAIPQTAGSPEPGRIRRLLESLAARVVPSMDDNAVFAYHEPEKPDSDQPEADGSGSKDG